MVCSILKSIYYFADYLVEHEIIDISMATKIKQSCVNLFVKSRDSIDTTNAARMLFKRSEDLFGGE